MVYNHITTLSDTLFNNKNHFYTKPVAESRRDMVSGAVGTPTLALGPLKLTPILQVD
jgi:hypothetical protein